MINIDIERLIDAVEEENSTYSDYCHNAKTLYNGPFEELGKRKDHLKYANEYHDKAQTVVWTLIEVFNINTDKEAQARLYIAARAVRRWRIATNWERLIPDTMQEQIRNFIFGKPAAPNFTCERCGCWQV